ncbi:MAG: helix-turn-helix domain-containing protein [Acaryochloridaceae cyanobacterium RL_2_7]|nr:helix-turn-helix domain-containing protein [Acaryochloridaceae cyanobacterium RL_2_7]
MTQDVQISKDYTDRLRDLMKPLGINSFRELCERSGVPRSQLTKIRRGQFDRIPWQSFAAIAQTLEIAVPKILRLFELIDADRSHADTDSTATPSQESSKEQWQREGLEILESLMLQLPTASFAAQKNPTAPAVRLLPLLNPLEHLLESWDVERVGTVGEQTAFEPQLHQWMGPGEMPEEGSLVTFRYVGYRHGDRLLHRAKVGAI